jgi:hypothetical protein
LPTERWRVYKKSSRTAAVLHCTGDPHRKNPSGTASQPSGCRKTVVKRKTACAPKASQAVKRCDLEICRDTRYSFPPARADNPDPPMTQGRRNSLNCARKRKCAPQRRICKLLRRKWERQHEVKGHNLYRTALQVPLQPTQSQVKGSGRTFRPEPFARQTVT